MIKPVLGRLRARLDPAFRRRWGRRLLALTLGIGFSLVTAELLLRLSIPILPEPASSIVLEARETRHNVDRIYRQVAIPLPPTPQEPVDWVVVGDSFAFGMNVPATKAFPTVFGQLSQSTVINLGIVGTEPVQFNRMLRVARRYRPKQVLYALYANDLVTATAAAHRLARLEGRAPQRYLTDKDLFVDASAIPPSLQREQRRQRWLYSSLLYRCYRGLQHPTFARERYPVVIQDQYYILLGGSFWDHRLARNHSGVPEAIDHTVALVRQGQRLLAADAIDLSVVMIPTKEMVYGPIADNAVQPSLGFDAHLETYRHTRQKLEALGIRTLDLTQTLQAAAAQGEHLYFAIDAHFNANGHAHAAKAIHQFIGNPPPN